jgi:hypothetical protein
MTSSLAALAVWWLGYQLLLGWSFNQNTTEPPTQTRLCGLQLSQKLEMYLKSKQQDSSSYGNETESVSVELSQKARERCVLLKLFETMNGQNWANNSGWNTSTDHCQGWFGVNCSKITGAVEELELVNNNLNGFWSSSLDLPNLKVLMLNRNEMRGDIRHYLPTNASALSRLTLSFNSLSGCIPWHLIIQYKYLKKLEVGNNYVTGTLDESVTTMESLEVLSIGQTNVSGPIPSGLAKLTNLWFLDLEALRMTGNISFITQLVSAQYIHLKSNKLYGELPLDIGYRLVHVKELSLKHNFLYGTIPSSFSKMINLDLLDLSFNKFTGQIPSAILHLNLSYLDLSHNLFESISSNLSLPNINSLILANNSFNMTATQLIAALENMDDYRTLYFLDISHCGLAGPVPKELWKFTSLIVLNASYNYFGGDLPGPRSPMTFLLIADLSYNVFTGDLPHGLSQLIAIKELNLHHNYLEPISRPMPGFARWDNGTMTRKSSGGRFTCPAIRFNTYSGGLIILGSSYFNGEFCMCDRYYYGHNGICHKCLEGGICNGGSSDSVVEILKNYYPIPSAENATALISCSSYYQDNFHCNPSGSASCQLSNDSRVTACNSVCVHNTTGFLCSHCPDGYYKYGDGCLPCSGDNVTPIVITIVIAPLVFYFIFWLLQRLRPQLTDRLLFKVVFKVGGVVVPSGAIITLAVTEIVPTYVAEFYLLFVALAAIDHLKNVQSFAVTLFVYFQVLDTLDVCSYSTDCQYCSFAGLLRLFGIDKVSRLVNFHFSGITCSISSLGTPLGRLVFLSTAPLVLSFLVVFVHLVDHYFISTVCCPSGNDTDRTRALMNVKGKCKRTVTFILNVFYYPIAVATIRAFPYQEETDGLHRHMLAYSWIDCDAGSEYRNLVILASFVLLIYVIGLPVLFVLLFHRYYPRTTDGDDEPLIRSYESDRVVTEHEVWLRAICSPFKPQYRPYAHIWAAVLMLRRLFIALLLAVFPNRQSSTLAMPFTLLLLLSVLLIAIGRPYRSATRWELENGVDIGAFSVILITYTSMASRTDVSLAGSVSVFVVNVLFVVVVLVVATIQVIHDSQLFWRLRCCSCNSDQEDRDSYDAIE